MDRNDPLWQHWSNGWKLHGTKILPMGKGLPIMPQITPEQPAPQPVGERRCWHCLKNAMMLFDPRLNRTYCPRCDFTQPPRGKPNGGALLLRWRLMAAKYEELEGVTIEQQRGTVHGLSGDG